MLKDFTAHKLCWSHVRVVQLVEMRAVHSLMDCVCVSVYDTQDDRNEIPTTTTAIERRRKL